MGRVQFRKEQAERAKKYPNDRICFHGSQTAVNEDQRNMRAYLHGEITLKMLCRLVADSNYLEKVTEEQMLNELRITGWVNGIYR